MEINARAYNTFELRPSGLIKKSSPTERLADEIGYYRIVGRDINKSIFFPRLVASQIGNPNWILMERYGYKNLGQYLVGRAGSVPDWAELYAQLAITLSQFEMFTDTQPSNSAYIIDMLITKTEREMKALADARPDLASMFTRDTVTLNGVVLTNFHKIWPEVSKYIMSDMLEYNSSMIHGDMCFSNILYEDGIMKFIDPRGSFGKKGIFGDIRYDVAKLYHSVDGGYEFLINDEYELVTIEDQYTLHYSCHSIKAAAQQEFENMFLRGAFNKKHIKIIEGCIFIGMAARHYDSTLRQKAMYLIGVRLLNEAMKL